MTRSNRYSPAAALVLAGWCGVAGAAADDDVSCVILPDKVIEVSTAVEGVLREVTVEKGAEVKRGQVIAELQSAVEKAGVELAQMRVDLQAQIALRQAQMKAAERKLERSQDLFEKSFIAAETLEDARTDYEVARLSYEEALENQRLAKVELGRARALYELRIIRSPIDGIVVDRYLSTGEFAQAQKIFRIAQVDPLRVEVVAPIRFYGTITPGMQATIFPEDPIEGAYQATVTIVDRVIDAASGLYGIRLELVNPEGKLPAGIECQVEFADE